MAQPRSYQGETADAPSSAQSDAAANLMAGLRAAAARASLQRGTPTNAGMAKNGGGHEMV